MFGYLELLNLFYLFIYRQLLNLTWISKSSSCLYIFEVMFPLKYLRKHEKRSASKHTLPRFKLIPSSRHTYCSRYGGESGSVRSGISGMTDQSDRFSLEMMETDFGQNIQWTEIGSEWWRFFRVELQDV